MTKQQWVLWFLKGLSYGATLDSLGKMRGTSRQAIHQYILLSGVEGIRDRLSKAMKKGDKQRAMDKIKLYPEPVKHRCQFCGEDFLRVTNKYRDIKSCSKECRYELVKKAKTKHELPSNEEIRRLRMQGMTWRSIAEEYGYVGTENSNIIAVLIRRVTKYEQKHLPKDQWVVQPRRKLV